ncbi:hypothetical protein [Ilumatobacter coccineus]|uniref:Uncharacterized protein n=1 Tax=Ilumatobacter coccineus (strain NBRC 103263 / KCTC 29153 / YM16-304) TaxID=1313172 RepID=A0A6C7E0Q4_ILUCY|nr:hypothetical protein [Ilumatobacter coccineus]BAN00600.1 hypothetical protein YM304_02860 [Ilumatobacter coccineus YM16-304]
MPSWIDRLLVDLGRNIVEQGWAGPWTSIPPMVVGDELGARPLGWSDDTGWPDRDPRPEGDRDDGHRHRELGQELTASSSR